MQCDRCNAKSIWERHFERGSWGFGKRGMLCPWCRTFSSDAAALSSQRFMIGLIGVVVLLELTLGVGRGASNIWVWVAALVGLTVAHELVHAAVGWLVGIHIHAIRIGSGRVAFRFAVLGTRVEVCRVFIEGGACCVSYAGERKRWQIAAGIGAPLVIHAVLIPGRRGNAPARAGQRCIRLPRDLVHRRVAAAIPPLPPRHERVRAKEVSIRPQRAASL